MPSQRLLSLAIPIVLGKHDPSDDPAPPAEFRILKAGINETSKGPILFEAIEVRRTYIPVEGGVVMKNVLTALSLGVSATEAEALSAVNTLTELQREVYSLTGKSSINEALGSLRGMKDSAAQVILLDAKLKEVEVAQRQAEVTALVQQGIHEQKVTPAMKGWAEQYALSDLAGFKEYLNTAPPVGVLSAADTRVDSTAGHGAIGGLKWEALKPMEKHKLYHEARITYDAVKDDYEQRTGRRLGGQ